MKYKRILSVFLAVMILVVSIPFSVSATTITGVTADGLHYECSTITEEVTITGYTGESLIVTIPNEIECYPVTAIGENAFMSKDITEINFPDTLRYIAPYAFRYCYQLKSLIFPGSLEIIDEYSFEGCYGIEELFIPKSVTFFSSYIFTHSLKYAKITVDSENLYYYSKDNCIITKDTNALLLAGKCDSIPDGIEIISANAFASSNNLDVLEIPSSVTFIGTGAFAFSTLREITLHDGVEYISEAAFTSTCLESITMTDSVKYIGTAAFDRCYITEIKLPTELTVISEKMFSMCFDLKNVVLPENVEEIRSGAFSWCKSLEFVVIPKSVKNIDADAFITCDSLKTIYYCGTEAEWNAISIHSTNKTVFSDVDIVFEYKLDKNGDIDSDGEISANDILVMRKYLAKMVIDADINVSHADINGDGRINAKDLLELRRMLAA